MRIQNAETYHPRATDEDIVAELFHQFWFEWGARLCDAAVGAALRRHHRQMRSAVADQIRQQRDHAARLKRSSEGS
jgi:predicted alpha-1,6-mannanase (GH76 family)